MIIKNLDKPRKIDLNEAKSLIYSVLTFDKFQTKLEIYKSLLIKIEAYNEENPEHQIRIDDFIVFNSVSKKALEELIENEWVEVQRIRHPLSKKELAKYPWMTHYAIVSYRKKKDGYSDSETDQTSSLVPSPIYYSKSE